jgi:hypothetical protein
VHISINAAKFGPFTLVYGVAKLNGRPLAHARVVLERSTGTVVQTARTDSAGHYRFLLTHSPVTPVHVVTTVKKVEYSSPFMPIPQGNHRMARH